MRMNAPCGVYRQLYSPHPPIPSQSQCTKFVSKMSLVKSERQEILQFVRRFLHCYCIAYIYRTEAEFFDEIQTKVLTVFLLANHSHLYSFALSFLFLRTHVTSYYFNSKVTYTVKEKGEKPDRKPYPLPYVLRNPYSKNSPDYAQKPQ